MKISITWTPSGATQPTNFVLADSPANIPLQNFRITESDNIQEAQFFRAIARQFYDRGNAKTEVTFDTSRSWPDQNTAENFILTHATQFPNQGLITFVAGRSGAGSTSTRYLKNAAIESIGSSLIGCTTRHSYRIVGGVMATSPN